MTGCGETPRRFQRAFLTIRSRESYNSGLHRRRVAPVEPKGGLRMKKVAMCLGILAVLMVWGVTADAGWLLTDADGQTGALSKGRLRLNEDYGGVIMNAAKDKMIMFDHSKKVCAVGTVAEFCKAMSGMMDKALGSMPPEQRAMVEQMMGGKKKEAPKVVVTKEGSGGAIAGLETTKYKVTADGKLYEEVWLTTDKAVMDDYRPLTGFLSKFIGCSASAAAMMGTLPEATPEYMKLYEMGFVLKSVSQDDERAVDNVSMQKLEKKDIPDSEFEPPAGYRMLTFDEFVAAVSEMEPGMAPDME